MTEPQSIQHRPRRGLIIGIVVLAIILLLQWPILRSIFSSGVAGAPEGIAWVSGFDAAAAQSRQTGKPILLDFTASWCGPCQRMKRDAWPDPQVQQTIAAGYIPVFVDVDLSGNRPLTSRYSVTSIPTLLIVDADGNVLKRGSFMTRDGLLRFLERPGPA